MLFHIQRILLLQTSSEILVIQTNSGRVLEKSLPTQKNILEQIQYLQKVMYSELPFLWTTTSPGMRRKLATL